MSTTDGGSNENTQSGNYIGNCFVAKTSYKGNKIESRQGISGTLTLNSKTKTTNKATFCKDVCIQGNLDIDGFINTGEVTKITNADLPYVITKPGVYALASNLTFCPDERGMNGPGPVLATDVQAAITIQSSNVCLKFGCHSLCQKVPSNPIEQVPFCIGVLVPNMDPMNPDPDAVSLSSITICGDKGVIKDFSMYGVRVFGQTYDIRLQNLTIKNCGHLASRGLRPTVYGKPYLPHYNDLPLGPSFGVAALCVGEGLGYGMGPEFFQDFVNPETVVPNDLNCVTQLQLTNVSCLNNFQTGFIANSTKDIVIKCCEFDDTWTDDPGDGVFNALRCAGIWLQHANGEYPIFPNCERVVMENSSANRSEGRGDFTTKVFNGDFWIAGMMDVRNRGVTCTNCNFNGVNSTFVGSGSGSNNGTVLAYLMGGTANATFNNCHFESVTNLGPCIGFHSSGQGGFDTRSSINIAHHRSMIRGLNSRMDLITTGEEPGSQCIGFDFIWSQNITFDGCIVEELISHGVPTDNVPISGNIGYNFLSANVGVNPENQVKNVTIRGCVAQRLEMLKGGTNRGFQFVDFFLELNNALLENCIASNLTSFPVDPVGNAWSIATPYIVGDFVDHSGSVWICVVANTGDEPGASGSWVAVVQGTSSGYASVVVNFGVNSAGPLVFNQCKALQCVGAEINVAEEAYSGGWEIFGGAFGGVGDPNIKIEMNECEAIDNTAGFVIVGAERCAIRNCYASCNSKVGFVDIGGASGSATNPAQSFNVFMNNTATNNGDGATHNGENGNYNVILLQPVATVSVAGGGAGYTAGDVLTLATDSGDATVTVTGEAAGVITTVVITTVGTFYNTSTGVSTTGGTGTGATIDINAVSPVYPPTLSVQPSTTTFTPSNPGTYLPGLHNISNLI